MIDKNFRNGDEDVGKLADEKEYVLVNNCNKELYRRDI